MKRISLFLVIALFSLNTQAQSISSFLESLEDRDDYGVITVNKEMFKMLASFDLGDDERAIRDLINGIELVKVYINEDNGTYEEYKEIKNLARNTEMENLISVKDGGERVDLFTHPTQEDGVVNGLLLIVRENTQNVFIHMDGTINLKDLAKLTEKLDIDGLDQLKKITK